MTSDNVLSVGEFMALQEQARQNLRLMQSLTNQETPMSLTFGERAVGLTFNPSGDAEVLAFKREFASIIDRLDALRTTSSDPDVKRMASVAITEAQTSQMWAVKAVTWRPA